MTPPTKSFGGQFRAAEAPVDALTKPKEPDTRSVLELLHVAAFDSRMTAKGIADLIWEPPAEVHGSLVVYLGALRRSTEAVKQLIEIEEHEGRAGKRGKLAKAANGGA